MALLLSRGVSMRFLLTVAALVALACPLRAQTLKKVKIGIPSISASQMPPFIARELGYYRQEGFDTEIILMRAGVTIQAMIAGSIDYTGTPGASIAAAVQGAKLLILIANNDKPLYDLVVRPEISSYRDLKGKVFALGSLTGFSYEIPRVMLSRNGLDPKRDMSMILIGPTIDRLTALKTNAVQATVLEPPYNFLALREGYRKLDYSGDYFQTLFGALTSSEQKIKADPEEVRRFIKATARGYLALREQKELVVPIMRRVLKLADQELAEQVYDYVRPTIPPDGAISEELMRTIIETQRQTAGVMRPVAPDEVFNFSFIREAIKQLKRPN